MSNAARRVRAVFQEKNAPLTLTEIKQSLPDLKASQISMALCYHMNKGYLSRNIIENPVPKSRKQVWQYQYHNERITKETT